MHRQIATTLALISLSGCADPTAVQKFAQSAPPASQFQALLLNYAGLGAQEPQMESIIRQRGVIPPQPVAAAPLPPDVTAVCAGVPALSQMHVALVSYMNALGSAATAGTTVTSGTPAGGGAASGTHSAAALPSCPPSTMPVSAAAQVVSTSTAGPSASGQALTAGSLSTDLQNLDKAIPSLKITKSAADAASSLVILLQDAATSYLRERAVRSALQTGHDSFLGALNIEISVVGFISDRAQLYAAGFQADIEGISGSIGQRDEHAQALALNTATQLMLMSSPMGPLVNQQQIQGVHDAAQAYLSALNSLQQAYVQLYQTSISGADVLTPGTWTVLQPLLTDVANAYAGLSKL